MFRFICSQNSPSKNYTFKLAEAVLKRMNLGVMTEDICINYIIYYRYYEKIISNAPIWNYQLNLLITTSDKTLKVNKDKSKARRRHWEGRRGNHLNMLYLSGN